MSDQGFHEVQLSGKQLVFLFMSAVVLMVVVFLLGVNVGRGVRSAMGDAEVSAQADPAAAAPTDTDAAVATPTPAKPAQPELSYHDMLLAATPAADKGNAAEKAPPAPVNEAPPPVNEVPPPAPTPTPVATQAQPPAAKPSTSNRSEWFVQTGAYSTQAVADGQVAKLKQLNVPAFVVPPEAGAGGKLFRVRIGPYAERAQAEQVSSRVARQGFTPSITR
jgi:DedD protein